MPEDKIEQAQKFVSVAAYNLGQARMTIGAAQAAFIQTAFDAIKRAKSIMGVEADE